ncbi:MAG: carbohydrate ABC transporter permease [Lachnospiraceae bacterium]|nr:carbohydrate ABC transporter permease [Lachnospiraceae bacterium]
MAKTANVAADEGYAAKIRATKIFRTVICVLLCIVSIFPFYIMIINATRGSAEIQAGIQGITDLLPGGDLISNFKGMVKASLGKDTNVWEAMLHSAIIAVPATCLQVYFATFTAYGLTVYQFKLRNMAWSFIMAIMMIPAQVSVIGLMEFMTKIGLYNTYWPLIIPAIAAPSTVYFMKQYMQSALSLEIIEAARIDGSGELATFNKIALPLMKPAMATQAIFAFVASWNNLYVPNMMIIGTEKYTLPMFITGLQSDQIRMNYGFLYVSLTLTVLPLLIVYFALSKYIIAGVALGGVKE